ncbi:MAG: L-serine ammonia-lyase [Verrucomicrobia bacterium]|nr:L-serine ammonia-lyase [Verrucomicrobiota bacterium]
MESLHELYRIGTGPSSSHTMGPRTAAIAFLSDCPQAKTYRATLYGSLASTGRGHLTDTILRQVFGARPLEIIWKPDIVLPFHPNAMKLEALNADASVQKERTVYSVGGGKITDELQAQKEASVYPHLTLAAVLGHLEQSGQSLWEYVLAVEPDLEPFLAEVWAVMTQCLERGLRKEGLLPGELNLARKSAQLYRKAKLGGISNRRNALLFAYAHAASEENAAGGVIVTAPTCGACGVLPAVLRYLSEELSCEPDEILHALATAGLIGNFIKHNAAISGAEVGCQGEVGAACAMAAGAATQLLGGSPRQIEYAAEMAIEHHLGLTCDPICGLVQIPCIERNAHAATRAIACAEYALLSDGSHRVSFDRVVQVMKQTGRDLPSLYRETSRGGLAGAAEPRA